MEGHFLLLYFLNIVFFLTDIQCECLRFSSVGLFSDGNRPKLDLPHSSGTGAVMDGLSENQHGPSVEQSRRRLEASGVTLRDYSLGGSAAYLQKE